MFKTSECPAKQDPDLWQWIDAEAKRQEQNIELIASENYASPAVMAAQGELCRRSMGYDPEELITAEQLMPRVMPGDIPAMRRAVYTAIMLGYGREVESEEDVDLVLQELQLKKKKR